MFQGLFKALEVEMKQKEERPDVLLVHILIGWGVGWADN